MLLYENILYKLLLILHHNVYFSLSFPFSVFHTPFIYPYLLSTSPHPSPPSFTHHHFLHPPPLSPHLYLHPTFQLFFVPHPFKSLSLILTLSPIFGYSHIPGILVSWSPGLLVSWYPRHSISNLTLWLCFSFYLFIFIKILYINISI